MTQPKQSKLNPWKQLPKSEKQRLLKLMELEQAVAARGFRRIGGVDEAGRGPLAGPVVAAACVFKTTLFFPGINDSKQLTPLRRRALFEELTTHAQLSYGVGIVNAEVIDEINILQATLQAMREAVFALPEKPDYILVDGGVSLVVEKIPIEKVIKGDQRSQLIAAASIIAKETRDELMVAYNAQFPEYGFAEHKGYGTEKHLQALKKHGPCPLHRKTFAPVRELCLMQ